MVDRGYPQREKERGGRELVNVGIAAEKKEGKPICEDSKINDPKRGLFMVADGVSTMNGALASRFVGGQMQKFLGDQLDNGIENNLKVGEVSEEERISNVDFLVKTTIVEALNDTHEKLRTGAHEKAGTTASVVKLVELPGGNSRMYFANIGDSRIYVFRNGKLKKLTKDDNAMFETIGQEVVPGTRFTEKDAETIDQARSADELSDDHRMVKRFVGHTISKIVGNRGAKHEDLGYVAKLTTENNDGNHKEVQHIDLNNGDRIVITSDGVHNQLLETEMANLMQANSRSALSAETALQAKALEISHGGKGMNARSTKDDISAVVYEVGVKSEKVAETKEMRVVDDADLESWRATVKVLSKEMSALKRGLDKVAVVKEEDDPELLELRRELNEKQQEWAQYDYGVRKVEYDRKVAVFDKEASTAAEKQEMSVAKARKDNAEKRYGAYLMEAERIGK
jgi:PPM family protein phosphatase